jgi:hypothetical protein
LHAVKLILPPAQIPRGRGAPRGRGPRHVGERDIGRGAQILFKKETDKVAKIAVALGVTPDYLIMESVLVEDATDNAFFRKYRGMDPATKDKIRRMVDLIGEDE